MSKDKDLHEAWIDFVYDLSRAWHIDKFVGWLDGLIRRLSDGQKNNKKEQPTLCRECDDYAGDGMYCASNYIVYDFSTSRENCEAESGTGE